MDASVKVYTIGHSNHLPETFVDLLGQHGIEVVVDVRSAPYSRFASHFTAHPLRSLLQEHDVEYAFAGEYLGGRPTEAAYYKSGHVPSGKADYLNLVDYAAVANAPWFKRGIRRLIEIAAEKKTAIMCSEEDPRRCHRHRLIEPSLREQGVTVLHIRKDGSLESIEPAETTAPPAAHPQLALFGSEP